LKDRSVTVAGDSDFNGDAPIAKSMVRARRRPVGPVWISI